MRAVGADMGVVIDNAAERVWLIDENGAAIPPETTLLLLVRELSESGPPRGAARPGHRDRA